MFSVRRLQAKVWLPATRTRLGFVKPVLLLSAAAATTYCFFSSDRADTLPLSPSRFTRTTLIEAVDASSDTKLLTLSVPPESIPRDPAAFTPIWSVFIKDSDIQVERPYTPLEGIDENGRIKLWVKKYERGEVSRWLHSRRVGNAIEIRGPVTTWSRLWQNGRWDEVVLISGGTGITPFYQLLHNAFRTHNTTFTPRFTLLHGSRSEADLPPSSMMHPLLALSQKYPDRFRMHLFAELTNDASENHSLNVQRGRIDKSVVQNALRPTHSTPWRSRFFKFSGPASFAPERRVLVLVCGPEGMVNAIAGPYGRNYSQGKVGGILGELGLQPHQVWKL